MDIQTILLGVVAVGILAILFKQWTSGTAGSSEDALVQKKNEQIGELKKELEAVKTERDKLSGSGKLQFKEMTELKSRHDALLKEVAELSKKLTKFEAHEEQNEKRVNERVEKLNAAEEAFKQERLRVQHEDEERQQREKEMWDKIWTEHEQTVIALVNELCKRPDLQFDVYDNKKLPEGFHGQLKPDCLVGFLKQYVVFDAKISKSENVQTYINDQVKKTAAKVKGNADIYQSIFLVVPTMAMKQIKKNHFYEDGFSFYVIAPEAIGPILSVLKKIESYEFAEQLDPQDRENIVDLIASFHYHISSRNAADYMLMQHGLQTLENVKKLDASLIAEVLAKKAKMRQLNLTTTEQKMLTENPEQLAQELKDLTQPQARISLEEIQVTKRQIR